MRRLAQLFVSLALTMSSEAAYAQDAGGDWWGVLEIAQGARLRLALHLSAAADGKLTGTLDTARR